MRRVEHSEPGGAREGSGGQGFDARGTDPARQIAMVMAACMVRNTASPAMHVPALFMRTADLIIAFLER